VINRGINSVVSAFDSGDQFAPFSPEIAQHDRQYRRDLERMAPEDFAQVMKDTIYALFDPPFPTLGMTEYMLKSIRVPTMVMPGGNDIHPRRLAELVHRLVPNCRWAEVPPHGNAPELYSQRVLQFLDEVESKPR
jgi:pimeloyl-ACP methyl ester carboxylesterase